MVVSIASPGWIARKVACAGCLAGYPPLARTLRTAEPVAAGTCQENRPSEASATVTSWPTRSRTVAPLSAAVSVAGPVRVRGGLDGRAEAEPAACGLAVAVPAGI